MGAGCLVSFGIDILAARWWRDQIAAKEHSAA
jgi:hypothetical protein